MFFMADLVRAITVPVEIDFMAVSRYGSGTDSSGVVRILKDLDANIEGRHVVIVEDIVDSGLTLSYLLRNLEARSPAIARGVRAADQAGAAQGRHRSAATSGSRSPTGSRSATGWTTASASAACRTSPRWTKRRSPTTCS